MEEGLEKAFFLATMIIIMIVSVGALLMFVFGKSPFPFTVFQSTISGSIDAVNSMFTNIAGAVGGGFP